MNIHAHEGMIHQQLIQRTVAIFTYINMTIGLLLHHFSYFLHYPVNMSYLSTLERDEYHVQSYIIYGLHFTFILDAWQAQREPARHSAVLDCKLMPLHNTCQSLPAVCYIISMR